VLRKVFSVLAAGAAAVTLSVGGAVAAPPYQLSGAIFTTDSSGTPVNLNHYDSKEKVYLNGGPGLNAPVDAAGLPAGTYYFQVTDPSGKTLLSSDDVECRRVIVDASGVFTGVEAVNPPCTTGAHAMGTDENRPGAISVQLFPFDDTPNNGGVYKAWLTPVGALDYSAPGNRHGFVPRFSKTDNFKVKAKTVVELDTRFWRDGALVDGLAAEWTDTLGAHNTKWSEWNPAVLAYHEAHVEAVEQGTHTITVSDQPGCTIEDVHTPSGATLTPVNGTVSVSVSVKNPQSGDKTYFVDVHCV
jgi:hypothetical protein